MAGCADTHTTTYGPRTRDGVQGEGDAAQVSLLPTAEPRGLGAIQEALGGLGLGSTAQQNREGLPHGATARRDIGDGQ